MVVMLACVAGLTSLSTMMLNSHKQLGETGKGYGNVATSGHLCTSSRNLHLKPCTVTSQHGKGTLLAALLPLGSCHPGAHSQVQSIQDNMGSKDFWKEVMSSPQGVMHMSQWIALLLDIQGASLEGKPVCHLSKCKVLSLQLPVSFQDQSAKDFMSCNVLAHKGQCLKFSTKNAFV